jgi:hypothetical protein
MEGRREDGNSLNANLERTRYANHFGSQLYLSGALEEDIKFQLTSSSSTSRVSTYTHDSIFMRIPPTSTGENSRIPFYKARVEMILDTIEPKLEPKDNHTGGGPSRV